MVCEHVVCEFVEFVGRCGIDIPLENFDGASHTVISLESEAVVSIGACVELRVTSGVDRRLVLRKLYFGFWEGGAGVEFDLFGFFCIFPGESGLRGRFSADGGVCLLRERRPRRRG